MGKYMAFLSAFLFCAAGFVAAGEPEEIGYSCCDVSDVFQKRVLEAAVDEAEKKGVRLIALDAGEDAAVQAAHIAELIGRGVKALVVVPVDTGDVGPVVAAARGAGIPLVFANRNPFPGERPPANCFVITSDSLSEGEAQMRHAGERLGGRGRIGIIGGLASNEAAQNRTLGIKQVIAESFPGIEIVAEATADWRRDRAGAVMTEWLSRPGAEGLDAVLANNDEMALGVLEVLAEAGVKKAIPVWGVDALPEALSAVRAGRMAGTVSQDAEMQGRGAVGVAVRAIRGESQAQNFILPSRLVTKENVDALLEKMVKKEVK